MKRTLLWSVVAWVAGLVTFDIVDAMFPFPERGLERHGESPRVFSSDGTPMRVGLGAGGERRVEVPLSDISPHLVRALIVAEDRRFFSHRGVDGRAVVRAVGANLEGRREGASTLSMQLARLADPEPRTLSGKAVQIFRALQLEKHRDKRFILERYLNLAPFGGNLRGVGATAHAWFGKHPRDLTAAEAALLISVLPSPTRFSPWRDPEGARTRRDRILRALGEPTDVGLGLARTPFPDVAPHAWMRAGEGVTTIGLDLQAAVESIVAGVSASEVDGVAVVVIDNENGAVRALAGAKEPSARVLDATVRPRSAGSTLKPFLYALALDRGMIAPNTRLLDLPWSARDWSPRNFDERFRGPVPASLALRESYNLPAIRLAADLPRGALLDTLRRAGLAHLRAGGPAVDLVLGTDDVTVMEIAGAYAALANGGIWERPWLVTRSGTRTRVCSRGAAQLVTRMLADPRRARPDGAAAHGVAWKTGTSSRRRDAWAAGFTRRFTAVVWRGRLDGRPDASLVGARAAVPMLFDVLAAADRQPARFLEPDAVENVEACPESGRRRTANCPSDSTAVHIDRRPRGARPLRACPIHKKIRVDAGRLCCARCPVRGRERSAALYPPAWAHWRARRGLSVAAVPPHHPDCNDPDEPDALRPVLLAPVDGQTLGRGEVVVRALASDPKATLMVLVDGVPRGRVRSGEALALKLAPGKHTLAVVGRGSHHADAAITVRR